jgi:hypothetical protein
MTQPMRQDLIQRAIQVQAPAGGFPVEDDEAVSPPMSANDRVQAAIALPQQEVSMKQRAMLGLIKEDPTLQERFLQRQGFETKMEEGVLKFKRGDKFVRANPEGFDFGDIVEYLPEIVEGVAGAAATSAKALGAIGAPATGGAGLLAGSAVGGAVTAGAELAKQGLAKGLGLREDINLKRVARQGVIGAAVPGLIEGAGAVVKGTKQGLGKAIFGAVPEEAVDVAGIKEAGKLIGAKPTPGMLTSDPGVRMTESVLSKQTLGVGGSMLRTQQRVNEQAAIRTAEELVNAKTARSAFEVGESFKNRVMADIGKKLEPAEKLYGEVAEQLGDVRAETKAISGAIDRLSERFKFSADAKRLLNKAKAQVGSIKSVEDLKAFRTAVADDLSPTASKNLKIAADELYNAATKARTDSFEQGVRNLKGQFAPAEQTKLLGKLKEADKIYAETARDVQKALLKPGAKIKKGVKREAAEALEKVLPERRLEKFLPTQDVQRAAALERLSKEGFDELSSARIAYIAEKATSTARGQFGQVNPQSVAREIGKLSPELAKKIFGAEGVKKAEALQKFYRAIPGDINPSGTATTLDILAFPFRQVSSASLSALNAFLRFKGDVTKAPLFIELSRQMDKGNDTSQRNKGR